MSMVVVGERESRIAKGWNEEVVLQKNLGKLTNTPKKKFVIRDPSCCDDAQLTTWTQNREYGDDKNVVSA